MQKTPNSWLSHTQPCSMCLAAASPVSVDGTLRCWSLIKICSTHRILDLQVHQHYSPLNRTHIESDGSAHEASPSLPKSKWQACLILHVGAQLFGTAVRHTYQYVGCTSKEHPESACTTVPAHPPCAQQRQLTAAVSELLIESACRSFEHSSADRLGSAVSL